MRLKTYRDLEVWQKSMDLVVAVYQLTAEFPSQEKYGLTSQMQRAAVSIPANIAEGYGRTHRGDYLYHLSVSRGSLAELETHLTLAVRLGFAARESVVEIWKLAQDVGMMFNKLIQSLETSAVPGSRNPKPETRNPEPGTRNPEPGTRNPEPGTRPEQEQ